MVIKYETKKMKIQMFAIHFDNSYYKMSLVYHISTTPHQIILYDVLIRQLLSKTKYNIFSCYENNIFYTVIEIQCATIWSNQSIFGILCHYYIGDQYIDHAYCDGICEVYKYIESKL